MEIEKKGAVVPVTGNYAPGMLLADTHVHTRRSDGWFTPETLAESALDAGLSAVVVTDHDDVRGGFELRDYVAQRSLPLTVYPGSEITARCDGHDVHILALGIEDDVAPWQEPEWTVEEIVRQGGIPVLAHPYKKGTGYLRARRELRVDLPVSMEIYNASIADIDRFDPRARRHGIDRNVSATNFYVEHPDRMLGPVGGTDAHFRTVGRGLTAYEGDLLDAIRARTTAVLHTEGFERARPTDFVIYALPDCAR
ncbi:MAG: PHP domain-containing protein [Thermomicrobiales bacterium]|nr:PHP domain-containing protein [Thermomicrobiales bacterium]